MQTQTQIVKPLDTRAETMAFAVVVLLFGLLVGAMALQRSQTEDAPRLLEYQLSAYDQLSNLEQGTFNDLYAAVIEIQGYHGDGTQWPTIEELRDWYVPPFVQDVVWKKRGALRWTRHILGTYNIHEAFYLGATSDPAVSGSFLLVCSHLHGVGNDNVMGTSQDYTGETFGIWYAPSGAEVGANVSLQHLIAQGWQQIVPYKGDAEAARLQGRTLD